MVEEQHPGVRAMVIDKAREALTGVAPMGVWELRSLAARLAAVMLPADRVLAEAAEHARSAWRARDPADNGAHVPPEIAAEIDPVRNALLTRLARADDPTGIAADAAILATTLVRADPVLVRAAEHAALLHSSTELLRSGPPDSLATVAARTAARAYLDPGDTALADRVGDLADICSIVGTMENGQSPETLRGGGFQTAIDRLFDRLDRYAPPADRSVNDAVRDLLRVEHGLADPRQRNARELAVELERRVGSAAGHRTGAEGRALAPDAVFPPGHPGARAAEEPERTGHPQWDDGGPGRTRGAQPF